MTTNMYRRLTGVILIFSLMACGNALFAADQDMKMMRYLTRMEKYIYGQAQEGGIAERLTRLHKDLLGRDVAKSNPDKAENLYSFLFKGSESSPSMDMKLNYLEWKVFHETRRGKLGERLDSLDKLVFGKPSEEPLAFRAEQLIQMSIESGIIALHRVKLPRGTQFRVRLEKALSSKTAKAGDEFLVSITDDLILDKNVLAVGKGGFALGEVDQVKNAGRFGRSGRLRLRVNEVSAIDSVSIPVVIEGLADTIDKKKLGLALGASAVGYLALGGPVGLVGGIFVKGREIEVPVGTEFIVSSIEDVYVNGVVIHRK